MPICVKCGAPNPTVHLDGLLNGIPDRRDYCTACFDLEEFPAEIKKAARVFDGRQRKAKFDAQVQQIEKAFGPKLEELGRLDPRFSREAYEFVFKSLFYALMKDAIQPQHRARNVNARELIEACQMYARETWEASVKTQLKSWGIETSSDVGDIVFLLVENGFMGKRAEENREDFNDLPFLENDPA